MKLRPPQCWAPIRGVCPKAFSNFGSNVALECGSTAISNSATPTLIARVVRTILGNDDQLKADRSHVVGFQPSGIC